MELVNGIVGCYGGGWIFVTTGRQFASMIGLEIPSIGLSELLGALFGVLLGQLLTIMWDRAKRRADRLEERQLTEQSIASELRDIHQDLKQLGNDPEIEPDFPYPAPAYRSSVASGRFAQLSETNQLHVARVYEHLSQAQEVQEELQRTRLQDDDETYRRRLRIRINDHIEVLQEQIPTVINELEDDN